MFHVLRGLEKRNSSPICHAMHVPLNINRGERKLNTSINTCRARSCPLRGALSNLHRYNICTVLYMTSSQMASDQTCILRVTTNTP